MADDELQERIEQAEANWQDATSGNPGQLEWGFFCYGDASPAIGGGDGMFTWFPDRNAMLAFIEESLPYCPPGPAHIDADEVARKTAAVVEKLRTGSLADHDGIQQLNAILKGFSQLTWIGTVTDLLKGDHPYATTVRSQFRQGDGEENNGGPILEREKQGFFEFLESWGI
jgi:hypothetical protein